MTAVTDNGSSMFDPVYPTTILRSRCVPSAFAKIKNEINLQGSGWIEFRVVSS